MMKMSKEDVLIGLESHGQHECDICPYRNLPNCSCELANDAAGLLWNPKEIEDDEKTGVDMLIAEVKGLYDQAQNTPARITLAKILEALEPIRKTACYSATVNTIYSLVTPFAYPSFQSGIFDTICRDVAERAKKYFPASEKKED